jgi:hypothetical protein
VLDGQLAVPAAGYGVAGKGDPVRVDQQPPGISLQIPQGLHQLAQWYRVALAWASE